MTKAVLFIQSFRCKFFSAPSVAHKATGAASAHKLIAFFVSSVCAMLLSTSSAYAAGAGSDVSSFTYLFAIFVLAIFVGYFVVWAVTPALHTPLMAVTNAISSVIVVGALLADAVDSSGLGAANIFGFLALVMAEINIFGGFLVTQRMLAMYKKKDR